MPLCSLHLLSLSIPLPTFLQNLKSTYATASQNDRPLVVSRVVRWIIVPERLAVDTLRPSSQKWDLLLILPGTNDLPNSITSAVKDKYTLIAGIPSSLVNGFSARNSQLLHPKQTPPLTGALDNPRKASSAQNLEFTSELESWIKSHDPDRKRGAVSMLNLLAFKPDTHANYQHYGKQFAESIGAKRGGTAKLVGKVTAGGQDGKGDGWEEIALAHYPSMWHFADMAASQDYQEVNLRYRVPSLKDTCILCTSEVDWPGESKL